MKLLALLALTFSVTAFSQSTLVHVPDGSTATCATKTDTFQYMEGVYKLSSPQVSITNETLKLTLAADFYTCGEFDGVIGFKRIGFLETYRKDIYSDLVGLESIEISTESAAINFVRDGFYNVIASAALSNSTSKVTVEIKLSDLLTTEEINALHLGQEVQASVDAALLKTIIVKTSSQEYKTPAFFGTFRTQLTIKSENGTLKVIKK